MSGVRGSPVSEIETRPRATLRLALFGAAAVVSLAYGFLAHTPAQAGERVQTFGYAAMLATTAWWLATLARLAPPFREWGAAGKRWIAAPENRRAVAIMGALLLVALMIFPYGYKVLYDEVVLQSAGWHMHLYRDAGSVVRAYHVEGVFSPLTMYLDKRPLFFPFALSAVHDLTGYREANAFVLNTLLLPVSLGLLFAFARRIGGGRAALAAMLCFGASPLLAQNANGAGMEMLNLCMLLLVMCLAAAYLDRPDEPRLSALILSAVLLAQTRYESSLYVLSVAVIILVGWKRAKRIILPPAAVAAPLLLIPCALHHTYLSGTPLLWELRSDLHSRFDLVHVPGNLKHALAYLFGWSRVVLNTWWLAVLGLSAFVAGIFAALKAVRHPHRLKSPAIVLAAFASVALANLALLMCYFWGQLDDPIVSRLILPFNAILAGALAWGIARIPGAWRERVSTIVAVGAVICYVGWGLPAAAYHRGINQLNSEIEWEMHEVAQRPHVPRLIITNKSTLGWIIREIPAIQIDRAVLAQDSIKFHFDRGTFREVLVMQLYRPTDSEGRFHLDPNDRLPDSFVLEPVTERHIGARIARISRLVEIRPSPPRANGTPTDQAGEGVGSAADVTLVAY